ncbi:MAG TPA: glycosyltransferase family 9 protein, partial [candidate division Zixibacteria bacterium]|nr:glycosyltransferase family 9 protein [candidate division Zixibacteria bacterium]
MVNLKLRSPLARIHFLTKPQFADVAAGLPYVDEVIALSETSAAGLVAAALELEERRFDLIVDLHGNLRSRTLTGLIPATEKTTVRKHRIRRELVTRFKRVDLTGGQTVDNYNATLRSLDPNFILAATTPRLRDSFVADAAIGATIDNWRRRGRPVVALAPGARHETKRAPLELFAGIADELVRRSEVSLIAVFESGGSELSLRESFSEDRYCELIDAPLPQVADVLRRADLTISNDSGLAHLSSAVGTPTAVVFGPTHPALGFAPRGVFDTVIESAEPCRPCSLHGAAPCYREQRFCFTTLNPTTIAESLGARLDLSRRRRPALFLDRDGVLVKEKEFLADPAGVELYPGVSDALRSA